MLTRRATGPEAFFLFAAKLGSVNRLGILLGCELALSAVVSWPLARHFVFTAFEDYGGTLNVQRLLELGYRPGVDFYYPYGLLPLLVARGWFGLFGRSTLAYAALTVVCESLVGLGLGRCARALRLPTLGVVFVAVAAPLIVPYTYFNVTHAVEMVLLVHALAEHARGRHSVALSLVTACAFVKPSMAYVYGLVLFLLLVRLQLQKRSSLVSWLRAMGAPALTGLCIASVLLCIYGVAAMIKVQFPSGSRQTYELIGYGFFNGTGRDFWRPPGARPKFYLGTFAGVWLTMTGLLVVGAVVALWRAVTRRTWLSLSDEFAVTTALLHVSFVCFFYGNAGSWSYYAFALILGTAATLTTYRRAALPFLVLVSMLMLVHARMIPDRLKVWRTYSPSAATAGLWATDRQRQEWHQVLDMTSGQSPLILSPAGCAAMLFPSFHGTDNWWTSIVTLPIMPGAELTRIQARVHAASTVVVAMVSRDIVQSPQMHDSFRNFIRTWHGDVFDVYRRVEAPANLTK